MKNDPHLYQTEAPILEGQTYQVLCGREIPRAKFVLMFDAVEMALPLRLLNCRCCKKCLEQLQNSPADPWKQPRYIYGIISHGEENEEAA